VIFAIITALPRCGKRFPLSAGAQDTHRRRMNMFGGAGGMGNIMRQAQMAQRRIEEAQKKVEALEVEGKASGGLVQVVVDGKHRVKKVTLSPELKTEDLEMIGDLMLAAVNDAETALDTESGKILKEATGGMKLPFNLGF
jgi:DNA-binding YbaB/EbfC family protein